MTKVSFQPAHHPRYPTGWCIRWREGGKEKKRYFHDSGKAETFRIKKEVELQNFGSKHEDVLDSERRAIIEFRERIAGHPEPKPTLGDAVRFFLNAIAQQLTPITVGELAELRVAEARIKGVHDQTIRQMIGSSGKSGIFGAFCAEFGSTQASAVTSDQIKKWAAKRYPTSSSYRASLVLIGGLFNCGMKNKFFKENPVLGTLTIPKPNAGKAHILTVEEALALLKCAPERSLPAIAIQLFAGLRKAECERLQWENIDWEDNLIKATQRKGTGGRREMPRFVPLLPTLRAWLEPYRQSHGPVFPIGRDGEASEQCYTDDLAKARKDAKIKRWDANAMRHSFGSYRYASIKSVDQVKSEMGHTTSLTTMEYYVSAVKEKEALKFWEIMP